MIRRLRLVPYIGKRLARRVAAHGAFFSMLGFNALLYMGMATIAPYLAVYYRGRGMSVADISVLTAIGPFVVLFAQPVWGVVADKSGRYMLALRLAVIGSMLAVLLFYGANSFAAFALCAGVFALFNCGLQPLGDTIVVGEVNTRGYRFSVIRMGGTIGYAATVLLVGRVLRENAAASFGITSALYLVMLVITFTMPKGNGKARVKRTINLSGLLKNRRIIYMILHIFIFQTALSFYGTFLGVMVTDIGYDNAAIGVLMCISAASEIPVLLGIDWALRRFRTETLQIFGTFVLVIRMLLPLSGGLGGFVIAQSLQGLSFMVMSYSTIMYISRNLDEELRGTGMAVLCVVQGGFASLFSNIIGGQLGERIGLPATYLVYAIVLLCFNMVCLLWTIVRRRREG